jgi:hypothetical protein
MLNVIGAAPLMAGGQFQPYASGGAGWLTMRGDPTTGDPNIDLKSNDTGWNAGFGLMGFLGQMGIRADLRYFKVNGNEFQGVDSSVLRRNHGVVVDDQEQLINAKPALGHFVLAWQRRRRVALVACPYARGLLCWQWRSAWPPRRPLLPNSSPRRSSSIAI